tara:strand:+ start:769 stop:1212 length:444 start_codon:yes stop_codon:yes gene_type:complete
MKITKVTASSISFTLFPETDNISQDTLDMIKMYDRGVRGFGGRGTNFGGWMHAIESNIHRQPDIVNNFKAEYDNYVQQRDSMLHDAINFFSNKHRESDRAEFTQYVNILKLSGLFESLKGYIEKPLKCYGIYEDSAPELRERHGTKN